MRMKYLQKKLKEDLSSILQQLDTLMEEELTEGSHEMPREVQFQPILPELAESVFGPNLLGVVTLDGILPSHLSLRLISQLKDLREGATLKLEVAETKPDRDSWQRRIVITVVVQVGAKCLKSG